MNKEINYIVNRSQGIAKYSDKLRKTMEEIDKPFREGFKTAGVKYLDSVELYHENVDEYLEKYYHLKITKADDVWKIWIVVTDNLDRDATFEDFSSVSRPVLKAAAKRIIPFLEEYSKYLEQTLLEYHELSQKTEKMVQAIL